jgi:O-antigen/teichoic acid export membrane protein
MAEKREQEGSPQVSAGRGGRLALGTVARSMVMVGGAAAIGQGAMVVAAPVLSRLYDPQAFGLLSVYAALLSVLTVLASLRFDFAIPIAESPDDALHLLGLSIVLAFAASVVVGLGLLLWGTSLAGAMGAPALAPLLLLLPPALFVAAVAQALSGWAVYHRSFGALGRMRASQGVAQAVGQTLLGLIHAGPLGLVLGDLGGRMVGMEQLLRSLLAALRSTQLSRTAMVLCARANWGFARVMTAASLVSTLSLQVPFLLIPVFFGLGSSGQYFLAYRVLVLPATLVGAAVSQVFFGEAAHRRGDSTNLHDLAFNVTISLFVFSIPTYSIIAVSGSALFETVFGQEWELAGRYAQIMAPWLIVWSVASPISSLLLVGRRERESLAFTAAEFGLRAGALGIGAAVGSLTVGIVALVATSVLLNISALWRFLRVASVGLSDLVRPVGRIFALTAPSLAMVVVVAHVLPVLTLPSAAIGWGIAMSLALRFSPEPRALLADSRD